MNTNYIFTHTFSNPNTRELYDKCDHVDGRIQCGGCSFYAKFNCDYGLCCLDESDYYLETVFEHFGCKKHVGEDWTNHSFEKNKMLLDYRRYLLYLVRECKNAMDGKKGIGFPSEELRLIYQEIVDVLYRGLYERNYW